MIRITTSTSGHNHLAVFNDSTGVGITSVDKDHRHEFMPNPATGKWDILPAQDGHIHEDLKEVSPDKPKDDGGESETVKDIISLFQSSNELEADSRKKASESEKFYAGDQWEASDKTKLEGEGRAALSINYIEPMVDQLGGYQRQNRQDIKFMPVEGGDQATADILSLIVKNVADQAGLPEEETMVFEDAIIAGRGCFHCYVDDSGDEPQIRIEAFPQEDVWFGESSRPDQRDLEFLCKAKWMSPAQVESLWPEEADGITSKFQDIFAGDSVGTDPHNADKNMAYQQGSSQVYLSASMINLARKEVRVVECFRREYTSIPKVTIEGMGAETLPVLKASDAKRLRSIPGVTVEWKRTHRMRVSIVAGGVLVDDYYPDNPVGVDYPIIPVYAKKRKGGHWGKVEGAKDVQREINKRHSQTVDVLNKCAAYGYFYDRQTFTNEREMERFKTNVARPGFTQEIADSNRPPKAAEGVKFPSELVQLEQLSLQHFQSITGAITSQQALESGASGSAIVEQRRQGMVVNEFLFDNLSKAKRRLAKQIVGWVQRVYTPERVARLIIGRAEKEQTVAGQPVSEFTMEQIAEIFNNLDVIKYDVAVSESAWTPTMRRANFQAWSELARGGVQVPPDVLVELSDLPNKEKIKGAFAAASQAVQKASDDKMRMELGKTLIAKGGDPAILNQGA